MKKITNFYNWLNYELSWYTHSNKNEYRLELWLIWQNGLRNETNEKTVNYTHTLKQNEL